MDASRSSAWLSVFASTGTLVCCALPALMVSIGAGAALSALVSAVPQLVWLSEHKDVLFTVAGVMLLLGGIAQWRARTAPCPVDPAVRAACLRTRAVSRRVYAGSVLLFATGGFFAYLAPAILG
jgi:predicted small integral membrane protein